MPTITVTTQAPGEEPSTEVYVPVETYHDVLDERDRLMRALNLIGAHALDMPLDEDDVRQVWRILAGLGVTRDRAVAVRQILDQARDGSLTQGTVTRTGQEG